MTFLNSSQQVHYQYTWHERRTGRGRPVQEVPPPCGKAVTLPASAPLGRRSAWRPPKTTSPFNNVATLLVFGLKTHTHSQMLSVHYWGKF